jgi:hypothetical protein
MAILNRKHLGSWGDKSARPTFMNESKSFTSTAGDQNSAFTVPAGVVWELRTLRARNADSVQREIEFILVDQDGTTHGSLSNSGTARNMIGAGASASWNGSVLVPEGWTVRAQFYALATGISNFNWQYVALEYPL